MPKLSHVEVARLFRTLIENCEAESIHLSEDVRATILVTLIKELCL